jgi:hypothetical protein
MKLFSKPTLITATVIYSIILIPSIILAPFSFFLYKSGKSDFILHVFAVLWAIFPIILITSILGSWIVNIYKKEKGEKLLNFFLLLPIIQSILLVIFGILHFAS